jgi:putative peptidoglycan lipid II flippase
MVPAAVGLTVLGKPIIRILFERGEFTAYSTSITESALFFYSFGLFAYGGIKLLVGCFYSMQDTMTPVKTAFLAVVVNIILNLLLMRPLKLGGLALATSISATLNLLILYMILRRRLGGLGTKVILDSFMRTLLASAAMGAVLKFLALYMKPAGFAGLAVSISTGAAVFILASYLLDVKEIKGFFSWIAKRR